LPTKTIAYLRVSTDKQADPGVSLDAQRAKVKAYAELYDLEFAEVIVDAGESAKSLDRPGLKRALERTSKVMQQRRCGWVERRRGRSTSTIHKSARRARSFCLGCYQQAAR
jgi:DNA invertase Pin-like site-specific DNA recombinase